MKPLFNKKILINTLICLLLVTASHTFAQRNLPTVHDPFSDFTLRSLDGKDISISDFYGKKYIVLVTYRGWVGFW